MKKIQILILTDYPPSEEAFYRYSDLPNKQKLSWGNIEFDLSPQDNKHYDAVLVLNEPSQSRYVSYRQNQKFTLMQEPGEDIFNHSFMFLHDTTNKATFSCLKNHINVEASPPYLGWYFFNKSYSELLNLPLPHKSKKISCIASNLQSLAGHQKRYNFVNHCLNLNLGIDFFGKSFKFIEDKWNALYPYQYSIAIENSSKQYYFTEKIQDCFLTYTVPLYFGCTNISQYFPKNSFIHLDINNYAQAIKTIRNAIENDDFDSRINDLKEARDLVLNKYHVTAFAKNEIVPRIDFSAIPKAYFIQKKNNLTRKIICLLLNIPHWHPNSKKVMQKLLKKILFRFKPSDHLLNK